MGCIMSDKHWRRHLGLAAATDGGVCRLLVQRPLDGRPRGRVRHELPGDCPLHGAWVSPVSDHRRHGTVWGTKRA